MIADIEKHNLYAEDKVSIYKDFSEFFEALVYKKNHSLQKEIRRVSTSYANLYTRYGNVLIDLERFEDAHKALEKEMYWNPFSAKIAFEFGETFKVQGRMDEFFEINQNTYSNIFHSEDLGRYYRNLGYYFLEKEEYQLSVTCYLFSLNFEKSQVAQSEILYILTKDESVNVKIQSSAIQELLESSQLSLGPNQELMEMAFHLARVGIENKDREGAKYFIFIVLDFYKNDELEKLKEEIM